MKKYFLLFLIPTVAFAGYGWERYVDPKIDMVLKMIRNLNKRVNELEQQIKDSKQEESYYYSNSFTFYPIKIDEL